MWHEPLQYTKRLKINFNLFSCYQPYLAVGTLNITIRQPIVPPIPTIQSANALWMNSMIEQVTIVDINTTVVAFVCGCIPPRLS